MDGREKKPHQLRPTQLVSGLPDFMLFPCLFSGLGIGYTEVPRSCLQFEMQTPTLWATFLKPVVIRETKALLFPLLNNN